MKIRKIAPLEVSAAILTALALVGHGGNEQLCGLYDGHEATFNVVGSCGVGVVKLTQNAGSCSIKVAGDDAGIPRSGRVDSDASLYEGRWGLGGTDSAGKRVVCNPTPIEGTTSLHLRCTNGGSTPQEVCSATLTEVNDECDVRACQKLTCEPGSHPEIAGAGCCPSVCVEDPPPPTPPNPCADVACAPCAPNTKARYVEGQCCYECVPLDQGSCATGRAEYEARWPAIEEELRACSTDDDCMYASLADDCRYTCPLPVNKYEIGPLVNQLYEDAAAYCASCPPPDSSCPPFTPRAVSCVAGRCEFAPTTN